jgi:hypothetical protein
MTMLQAKIQHGDRVTIRVPNGQRINHETGKIEQEWTEKTGKAVMHSAVGGWVLNMGGRHGTPGLADDENIVAIRGKRV